MNEESNRRHVSHQSQTLAWRQVAWSVGRANIFPRHAKNSRDIVVPLSLWGWPAAAGPRPLLWLLFRAVSTRTCMGGEQGFARPPAATYGALHRPRTTLMPCSSFLCSTCQLLFSLESLYPLQEPCKSPRAGVAYACIIENACEIDAFMHSRSQSFESKKKGLGERERRYLTATETDTAKRGRSHMATWATNARP